MEIRIFVSNDGLLYKVAYLKDKDLIKRLAVPKERRAKLLSLAHSSPLIAQLRRRCTLEKLSKWFYWPGMTMDIKHFLQECVECQKENHSKLGKVTLMTLPVISTTFNWVAMDIVGSLSMTERKNRYMLTLMDMATRYLEAQPLSWIDTATVADALIEFFARFVLPKEMLSDKRL